MRSAVVSLDVIQVASPCTASWEAMSGDERARFCSQCKLHVYDLSTMSRVEAEALVNATEGRVCVRFFRRNDGTILTQDCPVGLRAVRQRLLRTWTAFAACLAGLIVGILFNRQNSAANENGIWRPAYAGPVNRIARWTADGNILMGAICLPQSNGPGASGPGESAGQTGTAGSN